MELDLSDYRWPLIALAVILLLAGMGWLGYVYTPAGDKPLTIVISSAYYAQPTQESERISLQVRSMGKWKCNY